LYLAISIRPVIHNDRRIRVDDIWSINSIEVILINEPIFIIVNIFIDDNNTTSVIICQYFEVIDGKRSILRTIKQISSIYLK